MTETWQQESTDNGVKEAKVVRMKLGNGPEWGIPVDVIRALITSAWAENGEFMGRHLQYALTGELPVKARRGRNGAGGEG